ncbi:hypothetical protein K439DRAFT_1404091 [Ramaria rubella]|nr:hypothetical protein K439DRAFT_1404091 [Ramaria rubella]
MDNEREMLRLWNLVSEITEQLNQTRAITARLQSHAVQLHEQAGQVSDGATLRRFNTDLSKETFASELERYSVALIMENQSLLHENKQLTSLLQEYEQTLESVMNKFRGHSQAAQTHHLTLSRHYEALISRGEGDDASSVQGMDALHLDALAVFVRRALRSLEGKDPLHEEQLEAEAQARGEVEENEKLDEDVEWHGMGDWAEDRETEIKRLERENAELRRTLGITLEQERELGLQDSDQRTPLPSPSLDRPPFSRPSSFRDDRGRGGGGGRLTLGVAGGAGPPQRRPGPPLFVRRGFGEIGLAPERVASPPNDIRWGRDATSGPVVESI